MVDLADPSWKGRWAASPAGADFQAIVGAYLQLKGEEATAAWLKGMKDNAVVVRGNRTAMAARQRRRSRWRADLPLLLLRRSGEAPSENSDNVGAALLQATRIRARSSRSRAAACWPRASTRTRRCVPQVGHRPGRPGRAARGQRRSNMPSATARPSNAALTPLADLDAPKVDPSEARQYQGHRADDGRRPALSRLAVADPRTAGRLCPAVLPFEEPGPWRHRCVPTRSVLHRRRGTARLPRPITCAGAASRLAAQLIPLGFIALGRRRQRLGRGRSAWCSGRRSASCSLNTAGARAHHRCRSRSCWPWRWPG